ncbi:MAG: STAS-like domain-containing protein [Terriglobia bacterium]
MIAERIELKIATEFSEMPGPRKREEGEHSGEEFLQEMLRPRFLESLKANASLLVNLDGAIGYPTSFLEEAFGGLAREFGSTKVEQNLEIVCTDEPYLAEQISRYIREANKTN